MSTFEPSFSARPLVISGTVLAIPPDPVLVPTPTPVRLNHVSNVNCAAPKPGAAPNVTYPLEPAKYRPAFQAGAALSVGVSVTQVGTFAAVPDRKSTRLNS